jgi:hypothetical protein
MSRKPKFRPEITRVKLNPEQAVLSCVCYNADGYTTWHGFSHGHGLERNVCSGRGFFFSSYGGSMAGGHSPMFKWNAGATRS